jgi:hypothetical protein
LFHFFTTHRRSIGVWLIGHVVTASSSSPPLSCHPFFFWCRIWTAARIWAMYPKGGNCRQVRLGDDILLPTRIYVIGKF